MNQIIHRLCIGLFMIIIIPIRGAEFTNLNFESARLPVIPRGEFGTWQPIDLAMPGWQGFAGTEPLGEVLHNNFTLGAASISILGPDRAGTRIEGQYDIFLRPGAGADGQSVDVSIAQFGLIPANAQSLMFLGQTVNVSPTTQPRFGIFVDDQLIDTVVLGSGSDHSIYGVNVSAYAGSEATLRITAFSIPGIFNGLSLDALIFSAVPVPEPSTWALLGLGALALSYRLYRLRRVG